MREKPRIVQEPHLVPGPGYSVDRMNLWVHARRNLQLLTRRWPVLLLVTGLGLGLGVWRAASLPDIFRSVSVLRIAPRVQTGFTSQAQYQEVIDKYYENQLYDMQSAAVLDKVQAKVSEAYKNPDPMRPMAVPRYRALRGQGSFFQMVVEHPDFEYAKLFAETWAREFVSFKNHLKSSAFDKTSRATREEVIRYEEKLNTVRTSILDFKRRYDIANIKETLGAAQELLNQLIAEQTKYSTMRQLLENTTKEAIANGATVDKQLATIDKSPGDRGSAVGRSEGSDPLARFNGGSKYRELSLQMRSKEADRDRWRKILKPKHDFMVAIERDVERMQRELQIELDLIEESRQALLASYRQNERSYDPLIKKQNEIVLNSGGIQHEFNKLTEEESMIAKQLGDLRRSLTELDLTLNSNEDDLTISEAGAGIRLPVAPNRTKIVAVGLLGGLLAALGVVYLLHRLDDRLDLAEDIENALEEPVLGQIPFQKNFRGQRLLITDLDQHDMFSEAMRGVRSSVLLSGDPRATRVILITSAVPGDGKTTVTVNFAATLATMGQKVLLIDCDLRRGSTHLFLDEQRDPGLSEVLEGRISWRDAVRATPVPTLHSIATGALPASPGELLMLPGMKRLIEEARKDYDCIVLDTAPLISINDTFALMDLSDSLMFVVRAGQTSMRFARTALMAVRQREIPILGLVLNGITTDNPYYYYQQYYHAYYTHRPSGPARAVEAPRRDRKAPARSIEDAARAMANGPADSIADPGSKTEIYRRLRAAGKAAPGAASDDPGSRPS